MDNNKIKQGKPTKKHMTTKKLNKYVLYELKTRNKMQNIICIQETKNQMKKEITKKNLKWKTHKKTPEQLTK